MSPNQLIENAIVGHLMLTLIDAGFRLEASDMDGGGLHIYAYPDAAKPSSRADYWVRLTPGNGADIITDYSTNLVETMKPVDDFAEQWEE
jgi:hypothetical protein